MTTAHKAHLSSEAKLYFMAQLQAQRERSKTSRARALITWISTARRYSGTLRITACAWRISSPNTKL
jgi:protein subunit release factor B